MPRTKFPVGKQQQTPSANFSPIEELGVEGVQISSGFVHDEFLTKLQGERGRRIFREMRDNDSTIGAILFAVEMLIRAVDWSIETDIPEAEMDEAALEAVEFVEGVFFKDMEHTWDEFLSTIMSMFTFGWQYTEVIYKRRIGPDEADETRQSIYTDGRIGIRKLADRSQETLNRWEIKEPHGQILGMWQDAPNGGLASMFIPISKALLFRPHMFKGSPEGRSILRSAYRPWFFLKTIQEIEAVAIERELAGLPVAYIPNNILTGTTPEQIAIRKKYEKMVRDIKFNEQGGVVLPSDTFKDSDGNPTAVKQVSLELLNAGGTRAVDTNETKQDYKADIARVILADFIFLGTQGKVGSFALSKDKTDLFARAIEGWLDDTIAETINRRLIPTLWKLNGMDRKYMPRLKPGKVSPEDIEKLGSFVESLSRSGFVIGADKRLEDRLRDAGGLPERDPELDNEDDPTNPNNMGGLDNGGGGEEVV